MRLPNGDLPVIAGDGTSKSAASRRFVALSAERLAEWLASDLSQLDLLVIQLDGLHIGKDLVLVAALGIDGEGHKHPLGLVEGATENAAVVQALIDNLIERGLDPKVRRLFIIDGAKALSKVIRRTFGAHTPIQRCQIHKARNVIERLPKPLQASVRRALRQAWELDDADKAERLLRNLARRLDQEAPGVTASILEGLDEMLTVNRLRLPAKLRRSLACTNSIENMMGTVRRVCRNVVVIADAAAQIADPCCEAHLRHRRFVGTRPYKHVADLSDLTFRLLIRGVEFQAKCLAGGVLKGPNVHANQLPCIRIAKSNALAVADVGAKWIEVAIEESAAFTLVDQVQRFGLIRPQGGTVFASMALASSAVPWSGCCAKAVAESVRTAAVAAAIMTVRIMDFLPVRRFPPC